MKAEAIAELDAEDGFHVDHHDRFSRTPAKDFYKKPVLCSAHVVGITDPVKYRKRLEAVQALQSFMQIVRHAISGPPRMPKGPGLALPWPAPKW